MKIEYNEAMSAFSEEFSEFLKSGAVNPKEDEFTFIKQFGDNQAIIARMIEENGERELKFNVSDTVFFAKKSEDTLDIFVNSDEGSGDE